MPKSAVASKPAISSATSFTSPSFLRSARPFTITTASGTSRCRTAASVPANTTTSIEPVVSSISANAIWSPLRVTNGFTEVTRPPTVATWPSRSVPASASGTSQRRASCSRTSASGWLDT